MSIREERVGTPCLVGFRRHSLNVSPTYYYIVSRLLYIAFIMLKYVPSILNDFMAFIMEEC